ncbi:MAG: nucleotidyltransferase domain-containing protein [Spirochaetes bacterium]|nr:MAG: nucleotidyltransferase domain-containing protein [Spirochaetota bacterium]
MIKEKIIQGNPLTDMNLKKLIRYLEKKERIDFLILFGSYSQGQSTGLSDIDFAYYASEELSFEEESEILYEMGRILNTHEIDLVNLKKIPLKSRYIILYEGKLIFCRNEELFYDVKERVTNMYLDYKYYDDIYLSTQEQILQDEYG